MSDSGIDPRRRYLDLLGLDEDEARVRIPVMASELSGEQHAIRSTILDLQLTVEIELRRILFHHFRKLILVSNDDERVVKERTLNASIDRLNFGQMWKLIEFAIKDCPWPDLELIPEINKTRNQVAHGEQIEKIRYRGRNPFSDADCLASMYFDVFAIKSSLPRFFWRTIEEPDWQLKYFYSAYHEYKKRFGDIDFRIDDKRPLLS